MSRYKSTLVTRFFDNYKQITINENSNKTIDI